MLCNMSILFNKINNRFLTIFATTSVLLTVIIMLTTFRKIHELTLIGAYISDIAFFLLLQIPGLLPILIPIALFFSSLLWFHESNSTKRLYTLQTQGIPFWALYAPIGWVCCLLALANLFILNDLTTYAQTKSYHLVHSIVKKRPQHFLIYALGKDPKTSTSTLNNALYIHSKNSLFMCSTPHVDASFLKTSALHTIHVSDKSAHVESIQDITIPLDLLLKKLHETLSFITKKNPTNRDLIQSIHTHASKTELAKRLSLSLLFIIFPLLALTPFHQRFRSTTSHAPLYNTLTFFTFFSIFLSAKKVPYALSLYIALPIILMVIIRWRWKRA